MNSNYGDIAFQNMVASDPTLVQFLSGGDNLGDNLGKPFNFFDLFKGSGGSSGTLHLTMPRLGLGSNGPEVEQLQEKIGMTGGDVNGDFGTATDRQLKAFQTSNSISPTGVANAETWAAVLGEKYKGTAAEREARGEKVDAAVAVGGQWASGLLSSLLGPKTPAPVTGPVAGGWVAPTPVTNWTPWLVGGTVVLMLAVGGVVAYNMSGD